MSWKFNPFTGSLDYFESAVSANVSFYKTDKVVDSAFLTTREITLAAPPSAKSDLVFLNGLLLQDDCYTVSGTVITFDLTLPFKVGHLINVRYAA